MIKRVLISDNHLEFLDTRAEFLEMAGYQVLKATNPNQTRQAMMNANIHLAILDVRLTNDGDDTDKSGLDIARDPTLRFIPSIMLTDFPVVDDVRDALRSGESSAVDYVTKKAGPQAMIEAVNQAFLKDIAINWDLKIHWDEESGLSITGILGMLEKTFPREEFKIRSEEIEDLLCMVFYDYEEIFVLRKLWNKKGRIALLVQARRTHSDRCMVITFGSIGDIEAEIAHRDLFPDDPGEGGTPYVHTFRRAHYSANLWRLSGAEFDGLQLLSDTASSLREGQLSSVIQKLTQTTLGAWRSQRDPIESQDNLAERYRHFFPIFQEIDARAVFRQRVEKIVREARRLNLINDLTVINGVMKIVFNNHQVVNLADPSQLLFGTTAQPANLLCYTQNSPGTLEPDSILIATNNMAWLTDFAQTNEYPIWHDFAQLESQLRFTFIDATDLAEVYDLEHQLLPPWPGSKHNGVATGQDKRKYAAAILHVRDQAYACVSYDPLQYAQSLLFNVSAELLKSNFPETRSHKDTARLMYRLLLAGVISGAILDNRQDDTPITYPPLFVSEEEGIVRRGDKVLDVSGTEFRFLSYLFKNAGRSCERKAICREVFDIKEDPTYGQLHGQIDANLNRLRDKIEPDARSPHYIVTVHGRGIRLIIDPEKDSLDNASAGL